MKARVKWDQEKEEFCTEIIGMSKNSFAYLDQAS